MKKANETGRLGFSLSERGLLLFIRWNVTKYLRCKCYQQCFTSYHHLLPLILQWPRQIIWYKWKSTGCGWWWQFHWNPTLISGAKGFIKWGVLWVKPDLRRRAMDRQTMGGFDTNLKLEPFEGGPCRDAPGTNKRGPKTPLSFQTEPWTLQKKRAKKTWCLRG